MQLTAMKKSISVLLLSAIVGSSAAWAEHVGQDRAAQIAANYVGAQAGASSGLSASSVDVISDNLYLVRFAPKGWAIVSSDDCAEPIIAYSTSGSLSQQNLPDNMRHMISEASASVKIDAISGQANQRWTQIERKQFSRAGEPVKPLIQVNWNQSDPWNKYCPGTGSNKAIVGCVAVAMAQAMSVQQYPMKPMGQVTYAPAGYGQITLDYDKEPNYDWDALVKPSASNHKDEAARLMYHTGVSVRMNYGADGSGIPSNEVYRITNALSTNFGYPNVAYYKRDDYRGDWEQLLLNELVAGHALIYNAIDTKGGYGHSFNIDGYDGQLYHVNWGWGGYGDGYFNINALKDSQMNMNYDASHYAVTGIGAVNSPLQGVYISDTQVEEDTPIGSGIAAVLVNGSLPESGMKVEVTGEYNSQNNTFKDIPLEYKNGVLYTTRALSAATDGTIYVRVKVSMKGDNNKEINLIQGFNVAVTAPQPIERRISLSYDRLTKKFTLKSKFGSTYTVTNSQGAVIATGTLDSEPAVEFGRDQLTVGNNTVEVKCNGKSKQFFISL